MWAARAVLALLRKEFLSLMAASATSFIWHCKGTTFSLRFTNTSQENIVFSQKILCVLAWSFGHLVICQNRKRTVKIRHYNINILFIYSEQWPRFRNRKWPNDHDQMTTLKKGLLCAIWQLEKHSSICLRKHMSDKKPSLAGMALKME